MKKKTEKQRIISVGPCCCCLFIICLQMDIIASMQTCRLCISASNQQIHIFNDLETNTNFAEVISEHIGEVNVSDALPKTVCVECWNTTEAFHKFHRSVKSAQSAYLKSLVKCKTALELDGDEFIIDESEDIKPPNLVDVFVEFTEDFFENEQHDASNYLQLTATNQTNCQNSVMKCIPTPHTIKVETTIVNDIKLQEHTFGDYENLAEKGVKINFDKFSENGSESNDAPIAQHADSHQAHEMIARGFDTSCDICQLALESLGRAITHYKKAHGIVGGYIKCCGLKFKRQQLVDDHVQWHLNPNIFKCEICNKIMTTRNSLKTHIRNHKNSGSFGCAICGKIFAHKDEIRQHLLRTHANTYECGQCRKRYSSKQRLDAHERLAHSPNVLADITKQRDELKEKMATVLSTVEIEQIMFKHFDMTCDVCGEGFRSLQQAQYHYLHEHQQSDGYIKCCGVKFQKLKHVNEHVAWHLDPEIFKCSICRKAMPNLRSLQQHLTKHADRHKTKQHTCSECKRAFYTRSRLISHMENVHADTHDSNKSWTGAAKSANSSDSSSKHDNVRVAEFFDMSCDACSAMFTSLQHAKLHYWDEHGNSNGYIKCCDLKFKELKQVNDHLEYHSNPEIFKCKVCDKCFLKKDTLSAHMSIHKVIEAKRYTCDVCEKPFQSNTHLNVHKLSHGMTEKLYSCTLCDKRFGTEKSRKYHQIRFHMKNDIAKSEICEFCAKTFHKRSEVLSHIRSKHSETTRVHEQVQCEICKAWLANRSTLNSHMLRHTADPQKCPQCEKIAPNPGALAMHIRNVHTDRIHKCKLCDKSFKAAIALKSHMATHTGEKVYTCSFCPVGFSWGTDKYKHQKKAHPEEWSKSHLKKKTLSKV